MGGYEDNPNVEIRAKTHEAAVEILGGQWISIWHQWEVGVEQMREILTKAQPYTFQPVLRIHPLSTTPLSQALSNGRFHEKPQGKTEKKSYHVANAFSLQIPRSELWKKMPKELRPRNLPPSAMSA